jgi:hypothetical protein
MNRHQLAALVRGTVAVIAGTAILCAIGSWLGWWSVVGLACAGLLETLRWPPAWRSR